MMKSFSSPLLILFAGLLTACAVPSLVGDPVDPEILPLQSARLTDSREAVAEVVRERLGDLTDGGESPLEVYDKENGRKLLLVPIGFELEDVEDRGKGRFAVSVKCLEAEENSDPVNEYEVRFWVRLERARFVVEAWGLADVPGRVHHA